MGPQAKEKIRLLISDVDGVLTDGHLFWTAEGNVMKVFHYRDGLGFKEAKAMGLKIAFVSAGPGQDVLESRARHLGLDYVFANVSDKVAAVESILRQEGLAWENVAYIGDDTPDLECLKRAGYSFCPSDAVEEIKSIVHQELKTPGGKGCIRDLVQYLKS